MEQLFPQGTGTSERIFEDVPEGAAVDPTRAQEFHPAAVGISGREQNPRGPINRCRKLPEGFGLGHAPAFARRDECAHEEEQADIRDRWIEDEIVAIEEAGPTEPEKNGGGVPLPAGCKPDREQRQTSEKRPDAAGRIPDCERIGKDGKSEVEPRLRQHAGVAEQLAPVRNELGEMKREVNPERDAKDGELVPGNFLHGALLDCNFQTSRRPRVRVRMTVLTLLPPLGKPSSRRSGPFVFQP